MNKDLTLAYTNWKTATSTLGYGIHALCVIGLMFCHALADNPKPQVDRDTPEGQFLELVSLESDGEKKVVLLEHFLMLFPTARPEVNTWIYRELQSWCERVGQLPKALAMGEKLLAQSPGDLDAARANWRIAEATNDESVAKKWADQVTAITQRLAKASFAGDPEAKKAEVVGPAPVASPDRDEYARAIEIKEPLKRIEALEEFLKKSPQTPFLPQIEIAEFLAYREAGDIEKAVGAAEKVIARDPNYDNALLFIADINFRRKLDLTKSTMLATKFIEHMSTATKPDGVSDQEWVRNKAQLGLAYFIVGSIRLQNSDWAAADRSLRATLPFLGDEQFRATVFHQLGWVNHRMQNALEAIKFYRQCSTISSPFQDQAAKAIITIKAEYNLQ